MAEFGGPLMFGKLTRPFTATSTDYSLPTMFKDIKRNALLIVDNTMLYTLVNAVPAVVEGGYFHRCGVVVLIDNIVLNNKDDLTDLNLKLRSLWSAGLAVLKPWNGFLTRTKEGNFSTADIDTIAARVDQAIKRLPGLLKNPATWLVCVHRSGRPVHNGPKAPLKPKMELIISSEVCDYVRAVMEAETADHAINIWTPATIPAKKIKRLQTPAKTNRGRGNSGS